MKLSTLLNSHVVIQSFDKLKRQADELVARGIFYNRSAQSYRNTDIHLDLLLQGFELKDSSKDGRFIYYKETPTGEVMLLVRVLGDYNITYTSIFEYSTYRQANEPDYLNEVVFSDLSNIMSESELTFTIAFSSFQDNFSRSYCSRVFLEESISSEMIQESVNEIFPEDSVTWIHPEMFKYKDILIRFIAVPRSGYGYNPDTVDLFMYMLYEKYKHTDQELKDMKAYLGNVFDHIESTIEVTHLKRIERTKSTDEEIVKTSKPSFLNKLLNIIRG